jgi:hypothetical protein
MTSAWMRGRFLVLGRLVNLAFFLLTSLYCLLESSPFANQQFIRPRVAEWLADFVVFHADFYWLALSVTALTMAPLLERPSRGTPGRLTARVTGWTYLLAATAAGWWLSAHPVLPDPREPRHALLVATAALVPPAWVSVFDHLALPFPALESIRDDRRLLPASLAAACFCWVTFAAAVPFRLTASGLPITNAELALGVGLAAAAHASGFLLLVVGFSTVGALAGLFRSNPRGEYVGVAALAAVVAALMIGWLVLAPITITGRPAWIYSVMAAGTLTAAWSSVALHLWDGEGSSVTDLWFAPLAGRSRRARTAALVALPLVTYALTGRVSMFDWDFMLQKLGAVAVAATAFALMHGALFRPPGDQRRLASASPWGTGAPCQLPRRGVPSSPWLASGLVVTLCATTVGAVVVLPSFEWHLHAGAAFDAYLAADPSLRLARDLMAARDGSSADFYAFLRANAAVETDVRPIDISFVTAFGRPRRRPPHIFLFVVDSLRRDYVSPYNSAVTFTPALDAFARESVVFTHAFSRYGGTALSVPAIWAGGMIAHKEYVTPFGPMNALAKLLDAHDYRRFVTSDHITDELFPRARGSVDLDRGVPEMQHTFCRTMSELEAKLESEPPAGPVFAHTRPLDLHIGNVWSAKAPAGESYPGFFAPYAARVRQIDACFGGFIAFLRRQGLYDDSVVIVTADHGDSLGEGLRWGHGFTVFPEVLSIPLIVHLPLRLATEFTADTDRVSFTVDITPTLYLLAGDEPAAREPQYGAPLFARSAGALTDRKLEAFLVASSYGAVYGVLSANGTRLYIADATNGREYAFELAGRPDGLRLGLTDSQREAARRAMREQMEAIAADYDTHQP